jgi:predicted alpha-1,2-mannosidase
MLMCRVPLVLLVALVAFTSTGYSADAPAQDPTQDPTHDPMSLVNPMVGTDLDNGALYPGAALPFGMVKLSPDTTKPSTAGYNPDEPILGFSHNHIGGTGGAAFYGQLRVRPQTGELNVSPEASPKSHETSSPGYYSVDLTSDKVNAELTCTERVGFHRYHFPVGAPARVLFDLSSVIAGEKPQGSCSGCSAQFVSDRQLEGRASIRAGYGLTYTIYFSALFDQPATARGVWLEGQAQPGVEQVTGGDRQTAGLYEEFVPGVTVNLRVAISYTSIEQARENLLPSQGLDFDEVRARAEGIWRKHLAKIVVEGGTETKRRQFYTALYHTVLTPTDVTGDNGNWTSDPTQPAYWDIHTLWDTFRTTDPLRILIYPDRERGLINSLLTIYQKTGWLPDAWVANKRSIGFQGGTHADNVIADAVVKKLGGFDLNLAYEAVHKDATEINPKNSKIFPGFGRLPPYLTLGYVPSTVYSGKDSSGHGNQYSSGTSRTLEYAYNDFTVSEVADAVGNKVDAEKFRQRSLGAYVLFHPGKKLFWAKTETGQWIPDVDPRKTVMGWSSSFYEGNAWQYRFSMPHDMAGLIARCGGDASFIAILDEYFDTGLHWAGNEPGFLTPWLYIYAGRPDKTVDRVREILSKNFHLKPSGYPGDDDVGAMSGWYLFSAMGFYPNAGQDIYLIASPLFSKVTIALGSSGKTFVISAPDLSTENKYVQSATLNGKPWNQAWFRHADIINGAELVLQMGPKPSDWGTHLRPPSPAETK